MRDQLKTWGASVLADEAQLAVTELATNVTKHVGRGVPATLLMESRGDGLRIEMHDTSHAMPTLKYAGCGDECGRGLHLLASVAAAWGTTMTATGKAVWCEFPLGQAGRQCLRTYRASTVLGAYRTLPGAPTGPDQSRRPAAEECATVLIADLLHWLAAHGADLDAVLDRAQTHYEAEAA
ncbi:ATP-binding protein [Streptomyces corynorhini]|uniref:ATP-binding protein n=1 Tax=Streptomyces corynorhini TaxID=2282652 RepID=UPI001F1CD457